MRALIIATAIALLPVAGWAQSTPNWPYGYVPPVGEWNNLWASKSDALSSAVVANVKAMGADPAGLVDATTIINAAIATGRTVYLPTGRYRITNMIALSPGQIMYGDGRTQSVLTVSSDFNATAAGVVEAATVEPGAALRDIGISFAQPSTISSRASMLTLAAGCTVTSGGTGCKYPPAIIGPNAARLQIDRVRISGAWDGILLTGNPGGFSINNLEVGALDVGLTEDGGLDFCHLTGYHFWPFGLQSGTTYSAVYQDGGTIAANLGRCDDWDIRGLASFLGQVNFLSDATQGDIANLIMDGDGANLNIYGGFWNINGFTSTKDTNTSTVALTVTQGVTHITGIDLRGGDNAPLVNQTGGILRLTAGRIAQSNVAQPGITYTGGDMFIDGVQMSPGTASRSTPYIGATGTFFQMRNSTFDQAGSATGGGLTFGTDSIANFVAGNDFGGWAFAPYNGGTVGTYGPNKTIAFPFTPTIAPTTPGTWAPTYTARGGYYWYTGSGIEFEITVTFSTNAYTGTAGGIVITGLPFSVASPAAPADGSTVSITQQSNIHYDAGYSALTVKPGLPVTYVALMETGAAVPQTGISATGSFPASSGPFTIAVHGFIPTQ
jgi:hypothetical protein